MGNTSMSKQDVNKLLGAMLCPGEFLIRLAWLCAWHIQMMVHYCPIPVEVGIESRVYPVQLRLLNKLKLEWKGQQYDLLRHNCCHFAVTWNNWKRNRQKQCILEATNRVGKLHSFDKNRKIWDESTSPMHFSTDALPKDALCLSLGVGPVPGWVTSLAGVGALLMRVSANLCVYVWLFCLL